MTTPAAQSREIEQLKSLLFQTEAERLDTLETDLASLRQYVGGSDKLELATAEILISALERAEVTRPRELASVIAPSVVTAIRREIANSRDMMVDALYPITGRLVTAAVGNAFKELLAFLEQRISTLTSTELWVGRVKSLATGRPISEFVLVDRRAPRVQRLLMIERGSGRLVADWTREGTQDDRADLLSAMVAAIQEFSVQALNGQGDLQKLDFGGRELVLRASPRFILAAECTGSMRPADDARINALFFDTVEGMDKGAAFDAAALAALADTVESVPEPAPKAKGRGKIALYALLIVGAVLLAWQVGGWFSRMALEQRAYAALDGASEVEPLLAAFPLRLDFDHGNQNLTLSGIRPSAVDMTTVTDALAEAAAPYSVTDRVGVVAGPEGDAALRTEVDALQQSLARMEAGIAELRAALAASGGAPAADAAPGSGQ